MIQQLAASGHGSWERWSPVAARVGRTAGLALLLTVLCGQRPLHGEEPAVRRMTEEATSIDRSFPADAVRRVTVSVQAGTVRAYADSHGAVLVKAVRHVEGVPLSERERWLAQARVVAEQQGDSIVIRDVVPEHLQQFHTGGSYPRLDVEIHMPPHRALATSTGLGATEVTGEVGDLHVENGVGNVTLTTAGSSGDRVDIKARKGNVLLALHSLPHRSVKVEVGIGNIRIVLPSEARATVRMTTTQGQVEALPPLSPMRASGITVGWTLPVNGGGVPIDVQITVGDGRLEQAGP